MSTKLATEKLMQSLHGAVADGLAKLIATGDATPAHYSAAIRFLKDNNVDCIAQEGDQLTVLQETLDASGTSLPSLEEMESMTSIEDILGQFNNG